MPDTNHARMELEQHRAAIDAIDKQLVALLDARAGHSLAIRRLKPTLGMSLYDRAREDEIFDRVASYSDTTLHERGLHEIYETLLKVMKENPAPEDRAEAEGEPAPEGRAAKKGAPAPAGHVGIEDAEGAER